MCRVSFVSSLVGVYKVQVDAITQRRYLSLTNFVVQFILDNSFGYVLLLLYVQCNLLIFYIFILTPQLSHTQ